MSGVETLMNRMVVAAFLVTATTLSARGFQGPPAGAPSGGLPPPPPPQQGPKVVEAQKVKDNLYVLTGGGGNT
jgi:hypothetical protein